MEANFNDNYNDIDFFEPPFYLNKKWRNFSNFTLGKDSIFLSKFEVYVIKPLKERETIKPEEFMSRCINLICSQSNWSEILRELSKIPKGLCAGPINKDDLSFKCYDCGKENEYHIFCEQCFKDGDHKGHRIQYTVERGGCCDCGDLDAIDPKGFCKFHKGYKDISPSSVQNSIPDEFREYLKILLEATIVHLVNMIEECELFQIGGGEDSINTLFNGFLYFISDLSKHSIAFVFLITEVLMGHFEQLLKETEEVKLRHVCSNYEVIRLEEPKSCSCSSMELLLRFSTKIKENHQEYMEKVLYKLFPNFQFKKYLVMTFSKMFNFILMTKRIVYLYNEGPTDAPQANKEETFIKFSGLRPLYTQFFSEELRHLWFGSYLFRYLDSIKEFLLLLCDPKYFKEAFNALSMLSNMLGFQISEEKVLRTKIINEMFLENFIERICYEVEEVRGNNRVPNPEHQRYITVIEGIYLNMLKRMLHLILPSDQQNKLRVLIRWFLPQVDAFVEKAIKLNYKEKKWAFIHMLPNKIITMILSLFLQSLDGDIDLFESELKVLTEETIGVKKLERIFKFHSKLFGKGFYTCINVEEGNYDNFFGISTEKALVQLHYKSTEFPLFDIDMFAIQIGLALGITNNDWLFNKLQKMYFQDVVNLFSEAGLLKKKVFTRILEFFIFVNTDIISALNVSLKFEEHKEKELNYPNYLQNELNFFASQMFFYKDSSVEYTTFKSLISKVFLNKYIPFDKVILRVANLDSKKKEFRLNSEWQHIYEPSIWLRVPQQIRLTVNSNIKFLSSKDPIFDPILGNQNPDTYQPLPMNKRLLATLSNSQIFEMFEYKGLEVSELKSFEKENIFKKMFKLIHLVISLKNKNATKAINIIVEKINLNKLFEDLKKYNIIDAEYTNCLKSLKAHIIEIEKYMSKMKIENEDVQEEIKDETELQKEFKLKNAMRQEMIKNQFILKQKEFVEKSEELKNLNEEEINESVKEYAPCLCCLKSTNQPKNILGIAGFMSFDTLGTYYKDKAKIKFESEVEISNIITTCGHHIHLECQKNIRSFKRQSDAFFKSETNELEFVCPGCKYLSNLTIPIISHFFDPIPYKSTLPEAEYKQSGLLNFVLSSSKKDWEKENLVDENKSILNDPLEEFYSRLGIINVCNDLNNDFETIKTPFEILYNCLLRASEFCFTQGHSVFIKKLKPLLLNNYYFLNVFQILMNKVNQKVEIRTKIFDDLKKNMKTLMEIKLIGNEQTILGNQDEYFISAFWGIAFAFYDDPELQIKAIKSLVRIFLSKLAIIYAFLTLRSCSQKQIYQELSKNDNLFLNVIGYIYPYLSLVVGMLLSLFDLPEKAINLFLKEDGEESEMYEYFCFLFFGISEDNRQNLVGFLFEYSPTMTDNWLSQLKNIFYLNKSGAALGEEFELDLSRFNFELQKNHCIKYEIIPLGNNYMEFAQLHLYKKCSLCKFFPKNKGDLFVCVVCGEVLCSNCTALDLKNLFTHTKNFHNGFVAWINIGTSSVYQIFKTKLSVHPVLFYDALGQGYKKNALKWDRYILEKKKVQALRDTIFERKIPQDIYYQSLKNPNSFQIFQN